MDYGWMGRHHNVVCYRLLALCWKDMIYSLDMMFRPQRATGWFIQTISQVNTRATHKRKSSILHTEYITLQLLLRKWGQIPCTIIPL